MINRHDCAFIARVLADAFKAGNGPGKAPDPLPARGVGLRARAVSDNQGKP